MFIFRPSDAAVVRRTMEGQPQAFEVLVFRYQQQAHAVARALGLRPPATDDAVQEAFLQAFRDLSSLREPASFGGWFLHIVRHVAIKELRRAARQSGEAQASASPAGGRPVPSAAEETEQRDFREYLWSKVAELPQGTREAIFLYYYQGESVRAVAKALGLSVSGTKRRLRSGREALREKLWRSLEQDLRRSLPTAAQWRAAGRRLGLLVLGSIPGWWTARAGALGSLGGTDPIAALSRAATAVRRLEKPGLLAAAKKVAAAALLVLLLAIGRAGWIAWTSAEKPARLPAGSPAQVAAARPEEAPARAAAVKTVESAKPEASVAEPPGEDSAGEEHRGSVLVRLIWGEDRTPAAGVKGQVIPWASPDLYIDEGTFTSGPDGTARVDHVFQGGATVLLDRGGEVSVHVKPGETSEATIEVPPGLHVEGVVVDEQGYPVGGARVWISYTGHTNWGNEVASTMADGAFSVRSISNAKYIAARARGHVASDLRELKGEPGATVEVRLVLNGAGGELIGAVRDEDGEPVAHAKVMAGAEYASHTLHDDGTPGLSPPPYLGFTGDDGTFHADSLVPGNPGSRARPGLRAPRGGGRGAARLNCRRRVHAPARSDAKRARDRLRREAGHGRAGGGRRVPRLPLRQGVLG
jgi:RNA polymerase sigma factor (sigma-70 family)